MIRFKLLILLNCIAACCDAQQSKIDSIVEIIKNTKTDTGKIRQLDLLSFVYRDNHKVDSCIWARKYALALNEKTHYSLQLECWENAGIGYMLYETGDYMQSLKYAEVNLALSEKIKDTGQKAGSHLVFGHNYRELGFNREALNHYFKARELFKSYSDARGLPEGNSFTFLCIAQVYLKMKRLDSALLYTQQAYKTVVDILKRDHPVDHMTFLGILLSTRIFGDVYFAMNNDETALHYYRQYIPKYAEYNEINRDLGFVFLNMARIFQKRNQIDSAVYYAKRSLENARKHGDQENIYAAGMLLSDYYNGKNDHDAYNYLKVATVAKDSMISSEKLMQTQILLYNEQVREKQQAAADAKEAARMRLTIIISAIVVSLVSFLIWNRIQQLRLRYKAILEQKETEKLKSKYEKELLELEAKALRAQMNPHFIFNCLNSIKSLMQEQQTEKGITYLTTFSKLIRTLFNNADKKLVSLYDEIETCKYYLQLEALRFDTKFSYSVNVDENIDLKSIQVPALIIQPFIENAIWHGIVPRNSGGKVSVNVVRKDGVIEVVIDDDGIGREASAQKKSASGLAHQSKGVNLTQSRLELNNLLQQRQANLEVVDKKDEHGMATGSTVIIKIKEELS